MNPSIKLRPMRRPISILRRYNMRAAAVKCRTVHGTLRLSCTPKFISV